MSLYIELIKQYHPDVSKHPDAHKRTVLINQYKDDERELKKLVKLWKIGYKSERVALKDCMECNQLRIDMYEVACAGGMCVSIEIFKRHNFRFPVCPNNWI